MNIIIRIVCKICRGLGKFYYWGKKIEFKELMSSGLTCYSYDIVKDIWETKPVHGDQYNPLECFKRINDIMHFDKDDIVIDIGCGDGEIEKLIKCKCLYGIDIAESKIKKAKENNPQFCYTVQSMLDSYQFDNANKIFSYSVLQYCKPSDVHMVLKNSIDACAKSGGIIAHIEVPDLSRAADYYCNLYGISLDTYEKYKRKDSVLWNDGSYWHDMYELKDYCEEYLSNNIKGNYSVNLITSPVWYRTSLVIVIS